MLPADVLALTMYRQGPTVGLLRCCFTVAQYSKRAKRYMIDFICNSPSGAVCNTQLQYKLCFCSRCGLGRCILSVSCVVYYGVKCLWRWLPSASVATFISLRISRASSVVMPGGKHPMHLRRGGWWIIPSSRCAS